MSNLKDETAVWRAFVVEELQWVPGMGCDVESLCTLLDESLVLSDRWER